MKLLSQEISDTLKRVDEMRWKVKILLFSVSKELTNLKTKLTMLGDAHANIKQDLEQLTTQKGYDC